MEFAHAAENHQGRRPFAHNLVGDGGSLQKSGIVTEQAVKVGYAAALKGTDLTVRHDQRIAVPVQQFDRSFIVPVVYKIL